MIPHPFKPDPHGRDVCDQKFDEDGRVEFCGQRRSEHMDETHALKIQLATALKERDAEKAALARSSEREQAWCATAQQREKERDALRTALQEIINLAMDVADTPDWRKAVGDKARKALYGEAAWQTK